MAPVIGDFGSNVKQSLSLAFNILRLFCKAQSLDEQEFFLRVEILLVVCAAETGMALVIWDFLDQLLCRWDLYFVFNISGRFFVMGEGQGRERKGK